MKYSPEHRKEMSGFMSSLLKMDASKEHLAHVTYLSVGMALMFAEDEPSFNKHEFLKACGLT